MTTWPLGDSLDTFLGDFPSVHREQAIALPEFTRELIQVSGETCACCSTSASHAAWQVLPRPPSIQRRVVAAESESTAVTSSR